MSYDDRLGDYNDVASRMREFFERYPEGRLRPASPWRIETVGDKQFVVYEAAAYRGPDDTLPGIGTAWEPFPGRTPYTRDSELMNAETSAWGRAILAVGAADTKKGIASAEEVRNRRADREHDAQQRVDPAQARRNILANARSAIATAPAEGLPTITARVQHYASQGALTSEDVKELLRLADARRADVEQAGGEQQSADGDWPEPAQPGQGGGS